MHETVEEAKNLSLPHFLYKLIFSDITYLMYTFLKLTTFEKIFFKTRLCVRRVLEMILYIYILQIFLYLSLCFYVSFDFMTFEVTRYWSIPVSGLWLWVVLVRVGLAIQFGRTGFLQWCFHTVYPIYILAVLHNMIYSMYIIICINIFVENSLVCLWCMLIQFVVANYG